MREGAPSRPPWLTTVALAVFIQVGTGFAAHGQPEREPVDAFARVLLLAASAVLLLRHRHPVAVAYATAGTSVVYLGAGYPYGPVLLTVAVGVFAAVVAGHRHAAWGAVGLWWAGQILITQVLYRWLPPDGDGARAWGEEVVVAVWVVATVAVSELARTRREQRASQRAERALAARRRADEERLRIARELHDVLAHSISVINVQAGVGLALLDSDPEQARTALATIKAASKEALGEVRQVLDTLRPPGSRDPAGGTGPGSGTAPRAPAPGLARLPELVEQAGAAGLAVTVATEGRRAPLPPGTDLAAFRIVQEALTNVVRHSGSRRARVLVRYGPGTVTLRVDDDGPATGADAGGSGNGLAGMRERAAALRGTIEAGPRPDGGFRVTAVLPTAGAAPRDGQDDE
ncbi:two-component sensor histidine kinase [Streptomyces longispororuber]|uniref:histidine kinase n=1 Tax=Streptomyces longispororuber TaxID=68230 RepID=A0A919A148_9ACTN|nr:two-component sensor histidine kinase [Streptomyces longispororuber]